MITLLLDFLGLVIAGLCVLWLLGHGGRILRLGFAQPLESLHAQRAQLNGWRECFMFVYVVMMRIGGLTFLGLVATLWIVELTMSFFRR